MWSIYWKEINAFFSSLIGYVVIGIFLLLMGLVLWVFPDTNLLNYPYATLSPLFDTAPMIFLFLIPAISMRAFAEEQQTGTLELLATKPVSELQIILAKFFADWSLVVFALLPSLLYYYTEYQLGDPKGNLDSGAIWGSYIGLLLLSAVFIAIGLFASSLTKNQIIAFLLAVFLCFLMHWGFYFFSKLPIFVGRGDDLVQMLGVDYHYTSISKGVIDSRDLLYYFSVTALFLSLTRLSLESRKW